MFLVPKFSVNFEISLF